MFHSYRSGKQPISDKAWRKLEAAERTAGVGNAPEKLSNPADSPSAAQESSWQPLAESLMRRLPVSVLLAIAEEIQNTQPPGHEKQVSTLLKILRERVPKEAPPNPEP